MAIYLYCRGSGLISSRVTPDARHFPGGAEMHVCRSFQQEDCHKDVFISSGRNKRKPKPISETISHLIPESKPQTITLDDVWSKYLPWAKENKASWKDDEYNYLKHLKPVFGDKALDEIRPLTSRSLFQAWKARQNSQGREYQPSHNKTPDVTGGF